MHVFAADAGRTAVLPAADAVFFAVFGVFVLAFVVLSVITLRWAIRRDRSGREDWLLRRQGARRSPDHQHGGPAGNGRDPGGPRDPAPGAPR
jgi:hypothetical protein